MDFQTTIAGIPCWINVTYSTPIIPARLNCHPDNACPAEGGDFEFEVYTWKKGNKKPYLADWLARKLTDEDEDRLFEEYCESCGNDY